MESHHLPDGDESGKKGGHISVYLSMVGTGSLPVDWEVNAIFSIFLLNQISDKYLCFGGKVRRFHAMNTKRGFPKLISKTSFRDPSNGYLVNDNCVFGAEVFVIKSQRVIDRVSVRNMNVYKHDLVIPHFSKLEGVWTSEELTTGDYRWKILLCRNGNGSGEGKSVSIYAELVDYASFASREKVKAEILIRMKNKTHNKHHSRKTSQWYTSCKSGWGFPEFIPIGYMCDPSKGFVVDDCCLLETEISVKAVVRNAAK